MTAGSSSQPDLFSGMPTHDRGTSAQDRGTPAPDHVTPAHDRGTSAHQNDAPRAKIDELAESFVGRLRRGERPDMEDYIRRFPDVAEEIRDLFPTLEMLERCAPAEDDHGRSLGMLDDEAPRMLGDYRIIREVGRGGMGVVYEAEHTTMRRRVALKVLARRTLANGTYLERFHREARAAGRLHHTNIVPVFEVGADDGLHYYTMQFIQGQNLDVVLEELKRIKHLRQDATGEYSRRPRKPVTVQQRLSRTIAHNFLSGQFDRAHPFLDELFELGPRPATQRMEFQQTRPLEGESSTAEMPARQGASAVNNGDATAPPTAETKGSAHTDAIETSSKSTAIMRGLTSGVPLGSVGDSYYQRVARVGLQAAEALEYAHGQGILHRDIKPSNMILDSAGVVWITDFGLAKEEDENFTHSGDIVGTLRYMAPERFKGESDTRSDIYGLGLSLYELLTLNYAYDASDKASLIRVITDQEPRRPREFDANIPRDLETIILKAIHKLPGHRYASAAEMAEDLRAFLASRPIRARRISAVERAWLWCRRNPPQAILASCVVLLLTILFVSAIVFGIISSDQAEKLRVENKRALDAEIRAIAASVKAQQRLYDSYLGRAQAGRWSGRPGQHFNSLDALSAAAELLPTIQIDPLQLESQQLLLRNEAIAAMPLVDVRPGKTWDLAQGWTTAAAFDTNYERVAQSDMNGDIVIRNVADNSVLMTLPGPSMRAWLLGFSPDGQYLYAKHHHTPPRPSWVTARVWHLPTQKLILESNTDLDTAAMSFSAASDLFALARVQGGVELYSLPEAKLVATLDTGPHPYRVEFTPVAGSQDLAVAMGNQLQIWNPQADPPEMTQTFRTQRQITAVGWRNDGTRLVLGENNGRLRIWDLTADPPVPTVNFSGHSAQVVRARFSNHADMILSDSWDGTSRLWDAGSGQSLLRLDGMDFPTFDFSPDDSKLAFARSEVDFGYLEISSSLPWRQLRDERWSPFHILAYHPRRPWLLSVATAQGVDFWDLRSSQRLLSHEESDVSSCTFSPDGQEFYISRVGGVDRYPFSLAEDQSTVTLGEAEHVSDMTKPLIIFTGKGEARYVTQNNYRTAEIYNPADEKLVQLTEQVYMANFALRPQGDLAITTTWQGEGILLWNPETGELLRDLGPDESTAFASFSPDGKRLAVSTAFRQYIWNVGDWDHPLVLPRENPDGWPGAPAFSPDGDIIAMAYTRFETALVEASTGKLLAVLDAPLHETGHTSRFSPDGRYLSISGEHSVQVWDLAAIRVQLENLGLDWRTHAERQEDIQKRLLGSVR